MWDSNTKLALQSPVVPPNGPCQLEEFLTFVTQLTKVYDTTEIRNAETFHFEKQIEKSCFNRLEK